MTPSTRTPKTRWKVVPPAPPRRRARADSDVMKATCAPSPAAISSTGVVCA
jgi:hypothetical protein